MQSTIIQKMLFGLAGAAVMVPAALAQDSKNQGYLVDQITGNVVTSATTGLCVRTSDWTPARAVVACDPDLVPKPAPKPAPAPAPAPKPAPKPEAKPEAKPAPKPEAKPGPPVPVELKLALQGDTNFDFGKAVLKDAGKKEIDDYMATWKGVTLGAVIITGHTDRLGAESANKKLSEERAKAVKDYVVSKGVDQKLIFWEGKAAKSPIPVTKFCENKMPRKQLISCLAPNRRVEIEAVGTKPAPAPKPAAKP